MIKVMIAKEIPMRASMSSHLFSEESFRVGTGQQPHHEGKGQCLSVFLWMSNSSIMGTIPAALAYIGTAKITDKGNVRRPDCLPAHILLKNPSNIAMYNSNGDKSTYMITAQMFQALSPYVGSLSLNGIFSSSHSSLSMIDFSAAFSPNHLIARFSFIFQVGIRHDLIKCR